MKWIEVKVIFDFENKPVAADLISNIFYDFGLQGVVIEEPEIEPLEGWNGGSVRMPDYYAVSAYFPKNKQAEKNCKVLEQKLARLEKENGIISETVYHEIDEEDWAESWKKYFGPAKISERIVVKPTWREYWPQKNEIVLEIDPGMAFGTGTHPTTSLCLNMIEKYLKKGNSFLDVGTGSGILLIAAVKLGAEKVWGIDIDEVAVKIARKNLLRNMRVTKKFELKTGNLVHGIKETFDLVAANLSSDILFTLLDNVKKVLTQGGIFICSGIIEKDKDPVIAKMKNLGFEIIEILTKQNWVSLAGKL